MEHRNLSDLSTNDGFKAFMRWFLPTLESRFSFPRLGIEKALHAASPYFGHKNWHAMSRAQPNGGAVRDENRLFVLIYAHHRVYSNELFDDPETTSYHDSRESCLAEVWDFIAPRIVIDLSGLFINEYSDLITSVGIDLDIVGGNLPEILKRMPSLLTADQVEDIVDWYFDTADSKSNTVVAYYHISLARVQSRSLKDVDKSGSK